LPTGIATKNVNPKAQLLASVESQHLYRRYLDLEVQEEKALKSR
jgi:hypothetical protein